MWNSGLIGLSRQALDAPGQVVAMIDRMMALNLSSPYASQGAIGVFLYLQRHSLKRVGDAVLHY